MWNYIKRLWFRQHRLAVKQDLIRRDLSELRSLLGTVLGAIDTLALNTDVVIAGNAGRLTAKNSANQARLDALQNGEGSYSAKERADLISKVESSNFELQ